MNLRDRAKGQDCYLRLPGHCNFNPETVVLAHIRRGNGMTQPWQVLAPTPHPADPAGVSGESTTNKPGPIERPAGGVF